MKIYTKIKSFFNRLFCPFMYPSITRKEVLEYAKKHNRCGGLCAAIHVALLHYGIAISTSAIDLLFPLFDVENAIQFGADKYSAYWWKMGIWNTGREDFLNWLIERYKDDTTDLKEEVQRLRL